MTIEIGDREDIKHSIYDCNGNLKLFITYDSYYMNFNLYEIQANTAKKIDTNDNPLEWDDYIHKVAYKQ